MHFIAKEKLDEYNKYDKELKIYESKAKKKNVFFSFTFVSYGFLDTFWFIFVQFLCL
jgi:hypothetical protein